MLSKVEQNCSTYTFKFSILIRTRVEFLRCVCLVSGTVLIPYLPCNSFSSSNFRQASLNGTSDPSSFSRLAGKIDAVKKFQRSFWGYLRMGE